MWNCLYIILYNVFMQTGGVHPINPWLPLCRARDYSTSAPLQTRSIHVKREHEVQMPKLSCAFSLKASVSMCIWKGDWWQHTEHVGLHFQYINSFNLVEPASHTWRPLPELLNTSIINYTMYVPMTSLVSGIYFNN